MKKKITSIILTLALAGVCVLSAGQTVLAGTATYTDGGSYAAGTATQDDPSKSTTDIDVQAQTTGGGDIVYSVKIDWGAMKFEYDYGSQWDPATHKYIAGNTGKAGGGWNTTNYLNGINNKITVTNDSNFPINADFSYENATQFNATPSASAVAGMFDKSNTNLINAVDANTTNTQGLTAPTLALNTSKDNLVAGDVYYYQVADDGVYTGDMFFSLIGKPDRGIALTTMQSVGSIHVAISPATATTQVTVQTP